MKLTEIKHLLDRHGILLTKSLGQNFMHDQNQLRRIVDAAELAPSERVLEIGPGLGPLTETLLTTGVEVVAVETDLRLVEVLRERFAGEKRLTLIHADALEYLARIPQDWTDWKMVSNLPYSVASRLLVDLALGGTRPSRMVVTLQQEVAARIRAQTGDDDYGLLGLLLQLNYRPTSSFRLPAGSFFPRPEVDSACLTLVRRENEPLDRDRTQAFRHLIKNAFSQRRKMMVKLLRHRWPDEKLLPALESLAISPQIRAERVSREQFVALTRLLAES